MRTTRLIVPAAGLRSLLPQRPRIQHYPLGWALALWAITAMMANCSAGSSNRADNQHSPTRRATTIQNTHTAVDGFKDLPPMARERINSQMTAIQYGVRKTGTSNDAPYKAANPANGYGVRFEKEQVRVNSTGKATQGWGLTMRLSAFGYEGRLQSVAPATIRAEDNRLTYDRGDIAEWYVNSPAGIEQGFTLAKAPATQGSGQLQFQITITGGLTPRMAADGANIDLMDTEDKRVLTYRKLMVTDAKGKVLPAEMKPMAPSDKSHDAAILIAVNDATATYPLTVDPVLHAPKLTSADGAAYDYFGRSVAMDGDTVVVGADGVGNSTGAAYVFERDQGGTDSWGQVAKITADDGAANDSFGRSVAIDGFKVVVGADDDDDIGSVYIFYRDEGGTNAWGQVAKITADDGAANDRFGWSVAIDGDTVAVGARQDDDKGTDSGSAYLFYRDLGGPEAWGEVAKIIADDGAAGDRFGNAVTIDGNTVAVGADLDDDNGHHSGSAYLFYRDQGGIDAWGQVTKITPADGAADDVFGSSVAIDGDTLVVAASGDEVDTGAAYLFDRDQGGTDAWGQVAKITADDGSVSNFFGASVAINRDTMAVGATLIQGAAYLFYRHQGGTDAWGQVAKITAADGEAGDQFGLSVAIDGGIMVVGAFGDDDNGDQAGAVYVMDGLPGVTVSPVIGLTTTEAGGTATFTVVLASNPYDDAHIDLTSSNESECTITPANLIFTSTNWNSAQTVTITGVDDQTADGDQTCTVITSSIQSDGALYDGLVVDDVAATNMDDDVNAGVLVTPSSGLTTTETGGTAIFSMTLTSQPLADVTIDLTSSDPDEGSVSPTQLTFTPANWNQNLAVTVTGEDDAAQDGHTAYTIVTAAAQSSDGAYDGLNPSDVTVTNMDDDMAGVLVSPTSGLITNESGGSATFAVVLATLPAADVTIDLTSNNENEGTVSPASLAFTASDWDMPQTVTVTGVDDSVVDGYQAYAVTTGVCVSSDPVYNGMDPANVTLFNTDNDSASVLVSSTSGLTTTESGGSAAFTVVLTTRPAADVTIDLTSSNEDEGMVSPASLTFTSSNWDQAQTVIATGVDDGVDDGDQAYAITTGVCVSSDPVYNGMDPANVTLFNTDNDSASVLVNPTSGLTTTESGGSATFTVALTSQPAGDVTMDLSSSNTAEGTVTPATLNFTSSDWDQAQTVTVTGVNDSTDDGDQAYTITTGVCISSDPLYNDMDPANVLVTNVDDGGTGTTVDNSGGGGSSGCFISAFGR